MSKEERVYIEWLAKRDGSHPEYVKILYQAHMKCAVKDGKLELVNKGTDGDPDTHSTPVVRDYEWCDERARATVEGFDDLPKFEQEIQSEIFIRMPTDSAKWCNVCGQNFENDSQFVLTSIVSPVWPWPKKGFKILEEFDVAGIDCGCAKKFGLMPPTGE